MGSDYAKLKSSLGCGWNTWSVRSVLSHVLLPEGFALDLGVHSPRHAGYLTNALIARPDEREEEIIPGIRSYDGSYTELTLRWKDIELEVRSGTDGADLLILVMPHTRHRAAPSLLATGGMLWNRPGSVTHEDGVLCAQLPGGEVRVYGVGAQASAVQPPVLGPYLALSLSEPAALCTGRPRTLAEIQACLDAQRTAQVDRIARYGAQADAYAPMQTCMAWDTFHDPSEARIISPVSRIWSGRMGGYILYCWDLYFAAWMAAVDNRDLAYANAIEMTRERTERGFVPNFAQAGGIKSRDRSEPPVGALAVREIYRRYRETWFLEEVYDGLMEWNRWWHTARRNGELLSWGSDPYEPLADYHWESAGVNALFGAALESGLDNSPMYDDIPFDPQRHVMELHDVGLNSLYVCDCECLADIADVLGRSADAEELRGRADAYRSALADLWDDKTGLFLNRRSDTGEPSHRISPTNFYPLLAGAATPEQARRMVEAHLYNPDEFWGEWVLPSIARNDPAYADQYYWRGRIWPPMNFLVYLGLRRYGLSQAARDLSEKSQALLLKGWREHGRVSENYSPETGEGGEVPTSDRFYHWGGLLGLMALMESGAMPGPEAKL